MSGWDNVRKHMEINFDAAVRLTEALLTRPEKVARAILEAGPGGRAERYVPPLFLAHRNTAGPHAPSRAPLRRALA